MDTPLPLDGAVRLTHWGVMRAKGADAVKFLQGQLTNDVATLDRSHSRLAGFCSAKGRLQANFVMWKAGDDELLLACSASVLPATLKRMSMFVMRAQCKLTNATDELPLWGALGASAHALIQGAVVGDARDAEGGTVLRVPDTSGAARYLIAAHMASGLSATLATLPSLALDAWRLREVRSGIPIIEAATVDQFVPQMLNYELVGGIDFQKGCYPGQEVVARSQYRGTIKRRMFLFDLDASATPGQEVFHSADPGQPAGMVVNAAPGPAGRGACALVEVKLAALEGGSLHLGGPAGPTLRRIDLGYAVPVEATLPTA